MRILSWSRLVNLYLFVLLGLVVMAFFFEDQVMAGIVESTGGLPLWAVAALGWAPGGLTILLLGLGNVAHVQNPVRGNLGRSIAVCGFAAFLQVPVAFDRHSSDYYDMLAGTPQGGAFIAGASWAWLPFFGAAALFLTARWVVARAKGYRQRFDDRGWRQSAKGAQVVGAAMTVIALGSLVAAVATA